MGTEVDYTGFGLFFINWGGGHRARLDGHYILN